MITIPPTRLRELREGRLLARGALGERAGMARISIGRLEGGQVRPRLATIRKLAAALGVGPEELTTRGDPRAPS